MEQTIGRYKIEEVLGKGSMGKVYLAFDPVIERHVALKTIRVDRLDDSDDRDEFIERFFREARICGKLRHPGAVTVHDMGSHEDAPFIVMELIRGHDLAQRLRNPTPLSRGEVLAIIIGVADTLDAAHDLGIIHRDIKPQNIMLTQSGQVKILDFGIAKVTGADMTHDGVFWGTPAYASPEQIGERRADHRADIYAFGVLVHKILTGQDIYATDNLKTLFYLILNERPRLAQPRAHLNLDARALHPVLYKVLDKDPDQRYQRAGEFRDALLEVFGETSGALVRDEAWHAPAVTDEVDEDTLVTLRTSEPVETHVMREQRMRTQFNEAVNAGNLITARHLLRALERRELSIAEERTLLDRAVAEVEARKRSLQDRLIHHKRLAFMQQLEAGDVDAARLVLDSLVELKAPVEDETRALELYQEDRRLQAEEEQQRIQSALKEGRLGSAKVSLRKLRRLDVDVAPFEQQVSALEQQQMGIARNRMNEIARARDNFQEARSSGDPEDAEQALEALRSLGATAHKEETQLAELAARWVVDHADNLHHMHKDLKQAFDNEDWTGARTLVKRMAMLGEEEKTTRQWQQRLDKALARQRRRAIQELERAFEQAIQEQDTPHIRELQFKLTELGADDPLFHWLVALAAGEDPGPRPRGRLRLLALTALVVLPPTLWLIWHFATQR